MICGSTSWYEFAQAIFTLAPLVKQPKLTPLAASDYPTPAKRPANSRLSNDKLARTFNLLRLTGMTHYAYACALKRA
ncbi:dTDP-4-dehydrorhamnose reductase [bacterium endosymbiont of Mortierella elongata FMR23-6]|nr:dTDP-4-dehydrorhamnose reductase [bacterium endosymbiont of Mortierella elongata FMR23-6]